MSGRSRQKRYISQPGGQATCPYLSQGSVIMGNMKTNNNQKEKAPPIDHGCDTSYPRKNEPKGESVLSEEEIREFEWLLYDEGDGKAN